MGKSKDTAVEAFSARLRALKTRGGRSYEALVLPVTGTVRRDRDGGLDPASAQVGAVTAGVVCLVRAYSVRALARAPQAEPAHPDRFQDRLELRGVTSLSGRDHDRQGFLALIDREVDPIAEQ